MDKRKELTQKQRGAILYGYKRNDSYRTIAFQVGCSKSAVASTVARFMRTGSSEPQAVRTGRPSLITAPSNHLLKDLVMEDRRLSASQITNMFISKTNLPVSKSTVRRSLYKENLRCRLARPKLLVSEANIAARLNWCLAHQDWTVRQFRRVLWSDESTVSLFQQGSCSRVWREPKEEWNVECVTSTVKHSPRRMYWDAFSWYGVGPLIPIHGSVTAASYTETLQRHLLPALEGFPGISDRGRPLFQQDNARPHTAKLTKRFLTENHVRVVDWPAQSPDLNPIENVWHELKRMVQRNPNKLANLTELDTQVLQAWGNVPPEFCRRLVDSMPRRIAACIAAAGGPTKY